MLDEAVSDTNSLERNSETKHRDIERSYKYYHVFDCHRVLEDDKNSYQYRLKSKDPASAFAGQKNPFQQCNDGSSWLVSD